MKSILKNGIKVVLGLLIAVQSFANNSNVEKESKTSITVKSLEGDIVFTSNENNFNQDMLLVNLEAGVYYMEKESELLISVVPITITGNNITLIEEKRQNIFKPVVNGKGKFILFSRLSLNSSNMKIKIYNQYNELLYKEYVTGEIEANRVFDFSEIDLGTYKIVVQSNNRTFTDTIEIK